MIRIFFDSSALFSAAYSSVGGAREILEIAKRGDVLAAISKEVERETKRNVAEKAARALPVLQAILTRYPFQYHSAANDDLEVAGKVTKTKDIHVVAAAMTANCQYIISHDRAHLVGNAEIEAATGIKVVTPGDMLAIIRASQTKAGDEPPPSNEEHNSEKTQ